MTTKYKAATEYECCFCCHFVAKAIAAIGELVSDAEAAKVVETALAALGGIDILVNNAVPFR